MQNNKKIQIQYPCEWIYKVIGSDLKQLKDAVFSIIHPKKFSIEESRESQTGKYLSLNVKVIVSNEQERTTYYANLGKNKHIKIVL